MFKRAKLSERLTLHDLRRTFASWQANQPGANLLIVGKSFSHRSMKATEVYAKHITAAMAKSVANGTGAMLAKANDGDETAAAIAKVTGIQARGATQRRRVTRTTRRPAARNAR